MTSITFRSENAHSEFHSMVEGMCEVARDDGDAARAAVLTQLIAATAFADGASYPRTFPLSAEVAEEARTVLENLADSVDDSAAREIAIADETRTPEMGTLEALETAIDALILRAQETDTASPEGHLARLALETLRMLVAQRGCEHFDPAVEDGRLTTLCDVIVFG